MDLSLLWSVNASLVLCLALRHHRGASWVEGVAMKCRRRSHPAGAHSLNDLCAYTHIKALEECVSISLGSVSA